MCKGKLVSFIGMDGSGKSTLTELTRKALISRNLRAVVIYGGRGRGNILPIQFFGRIYRKTGGKESNVPEKGKSFEKTSIMHTLSSFVFAADLLLRYLFVILPKQITNDFVITDRYSIDILLMNKVPKKLKRFLYSLFPKPNKVFYIYNTINVLHKRKPEHPVEDLKRQEKIFSEILKSVKVVKIKNDNLRISLNKILKVLQ